MLHRRFTVSFANRFHFRQSLGDMDIDAYPVAFAQFQRFADLFGRTGVRGMRSDPNPDAIAGGAVIPFNHPLRPFDVTVERRSDESRTDDRPDSAADRRLGDPVGIPVHIDESGRTAEQHFGDSQLGPAVNIVAVQFRLERPNLFGQPRHQRQVVGIAAHQGHRHVVVQVNQTRHHEPSGAVRHLQSFSSLPLVTFDPLRGVAHQRDPVAADGNRAPVIFRSAGLFRHRKHQAIFYQ